MNIYAKQKQTHRYRKLVVTKGETEVGGARQAYEINRYKLLCTK